MGANGKEFNYNQGSIILIEGYLWFDQNNTVSTTNPLSPCTKGKEIGTMDYENNDDTRPHPLHLCALCWCGCALAELPSSWIKEGINVVHING